MKTNKIKKHFIKNGRVDIIQIIFILVFICVVFFILSLVLKNNKIHSSRIQEMYSDIAPANIGECGGFTRYSGTYIDQSKIGIENKLCETYLSVSNDIVIESLSLKKNSNYCTYSGFKYYNNASNSCNIERIKASSIATAYKERFQVPLESYIDFSITQNKICHYIEHDFICGNSYPEVAINDSDAIVLRELYDVKEQGKMVYLYDYFIYCNGGECYKDINQKTPIEGNLKIDASTNQKNLIKKYGAKYKHTFEKSNSNENNMFGYQAI